jgi:hypothetical protein
MLGLFLVFGLLGGTFLGNPALGVLAGLLAHLMVNNLHQKKVIENTGK